MAKSNTNINMIQLVDGYYFSCDDKQYILYYCGTREKIDIRTKKPTNEMITFTDTIGYYCTLESMLKGCARDCNRRKIQYGEISSFKECIKQIDDIYYKIQELTKGF